MNGHNAHFKLIRPCLLTHLWQSSFPRSGATSTRGQVPSPGEWEYVIVAQSNTEILLKETRRGVEIGSPRIWPEVPQVPHRSRRVFERNQITRHLKSLDAVRAYTSSSSAHDNMYNQHCMLPCAVYFIYILPNADEHTNLFALDKGYSGMLENNSFLRSDRWQRFLHRPGPFPQCRLRPLNLTRQCWLRPLNSINKRARAFLR